MNIIPDKGHYAPFYEGYVNKAGTGNILQTLRSATADLQTLLTDIPPAKWTYRYETGKWSIKEVVLHLIDSERVFAYRAMRVARNDLTPLPGFEQNDYVPVSEANGRTSASLRKEFLSVREATLSLFENFSEDMWLRKGIASGNPVSALALAFIIVGHQRHHADIIRDRYLA